MRIVRLRCRDEAVTRLLLTDTVRRREPEYCTTVRERPLDDLAEREEPLLRVDAEARPFDLVRASALISETHIEDATISTASTNVSGLNLVKTRFFRSIKIKIRGYQVRIIGFVFYVSNTNTEHSTNRYRIGSRFQQTRNSMTTRFEGFYPA